MRRQLIVTLLILCAAGCSAPDTGTGRVILRVG